MSGVAYSFQDSESPVLNLQLSGNVPLTPGHLKWHQTSRFKHLNWAPDAWTPLWTTLAGLTDHHWLQTEHIQLFHKQTTLCRCQGLPNSRLNLPRFYTLVGTQQHHSKVLFSMCVPPLTPHFPKEDTQTAQTNLVSLVTCHWHCRNRLKDKPYSVGSSVLVHWFKKLG